MNRSLRYPSHEAMPLTGPSLGQGTLPALASLPKIRAARSPRLGVCAVTSDERPVTAHTGRLQDPDGAHTRWADLFGTAPQIRVRRAHDRARDQLADLAVLNERLAQTGSQAAELEATAAVRRRVEYLKRRRRNWELVYEYVTQEDMLCTLATIEEANRKVEEALSEGTAEGAGVAALQRRLEELQKEVDAAQSKLDVTQNRVETNLKRIQELKEEAQRLQRAHNGSIFAASGPASPGAAPAAGAPKPAPKGAENAEEVRRSTLLKRRGLQSSLDLEDELRNHWFPVQFASRLQPDRMVPVELFGEAWVLFRDDAGRASCVRDECAHRACPLSSGSIKDGQLECPYHGWRFNGAGECTAMPSTKFCRGIRVSALPVEEADGFVWIWPGWREAGPLPLGATMPPSSRYTLHAELELEVPVEHGLLIENLLDLAHAPFTHTATFARGWAVPEAVTFQAGKMLAGNWQPYPIDMGFNPPCMTESLIGLAKPGQVATGARAGDCANHLHQVHVCLPAKRGHTRLLYRMSMDFMGWVRYVPGIQQLWKAVAGQVMAEDLVLVKGQQRRMAQGGDTWSHPVSYDKIAVRYRRWRNAIAAGGDSSEAKAGVRMSAGEMFVVEDDEHVYLD